MKSFVKKIICSIAICLIVGTVFLLGGVRAGAADEKMILPVSDVATLTQYFKFAKVGSVVHLKLTDDITLSSGLTLGKGQEIVLDLNGHEINRNGVQGSRNGYVISVEGKLTVTDNSARKEGVLTGGYNGKGGGVAVSGEFILQAGTITSCIADFGGGVFVAPGGKFSMTGGNIAGCTATKDGGGVCIAKTGTMRMSGGEIVGNIARGDFGGGVDVCGTLCLGGKPVVKNNMRNGKANNVIVEPDGWLEFGTGKNGMPVPSSSMYVGVRAAEDATEGNPVVFAKNGSVDLVGRIIPEGTNQIVQRVAYTGELQFAYSTHPHEYKITSDKDSLHAVCRICGRSVTAKIVAPADPRFDETPKLVTVENDSEFITETGVDLKLTTYHNLIFTAKEPTEAGNYIAVLRAGGKSARLSYKITLDLTRFEKTDEVAEYYLNHANGLYYSDKKCTHEIGNADALEDWKAADGYIANDPSILKFLRLLGDFFLWIIGKK